MLVNNVYLNKIEVGQPETALAAAEADRAERPRTAAVAASSHVPSEELSRLLGLLHREVEVREDRVQLVQMRLGGGYYLTPEAAVQTADAIQDAEE